MILRILVLCLGCWHFGLLAADRAAVPLTEATPESQGLDGARLQQAIDGISAGEYGDINALLVLRNDYLLLEHYVDLQYKGPDYRHPIRSVTKSFTSALIGIARGQGKLADLQTPLLDLFPQYDEIENLDERKRNLTLDHILSMTAGFEWDEFSTGAMSDHRMASSPDWIKHVLDLPMRDLPGTRWVYNSGCSMLLSNILSRATATPVDEYAEKYLFEPIGIGNWRWSLGKNDVINTSGGLSMTRRDMARLGVLYLNDGRWQGKQIVPEDWVKLSTSLKTQANANYFPYAYAYQWWRVQDAEPTAAMLETNDMYTAIGLHGQFVLVIPHLEMVIVSTAENFSFEKEELFFKLLRDHVLPAVSN